MKGFYNMEINDLRIFQTVAYEKSISKAALKLGYAQSNITMRIKLLENKLNTTLFIRNNKGTIITSNGEKLLKYADKILQLIDEVNERFRVMTDVFCRSHILKLELLRLFLLLFYLKYFLYFMSKILKYL